MFRGKQSFLGKLVHGLETWKIIKSGKERRAEFRLNLKLDSQSGFPMKIKRWKPAARMLTFARSLTVRRICQKIWHDSI